MEGDFENVVHEYKSAGLKLELIMVIFPVKVSVYVNIIMCVDLQLLSVYNTLNNYKELIKPNNGKSFLCDHRIAKTKFWKYISFIFINLGSPKFLVVVFKL